MSIREQLAILALIVILILLAILFPRPAASDVPVMASAVPAGEFIDIRALPVGSREPFPDASTKALAGPESQPARATPSPAAPAAPSPSASKRVPTPTPVRTPATPARESSVGSAASVTGLSAARAFALRELGAVQFGCLDALVERESRWNPLALNRRSAAFGLFQTYPASRLDALGDRHDPMVQMRWGLAYIHGRYGTPCRALDHAREIGWY